MLPKMRYRLGLDLGTSSIGWCLIRLDAQDKPHAIIRMGVRIFPDGRNPKDGSSLAVTRRQARQMRRRRDRLLKRKQRMLSALVRLGFFPQSHTQRKELVELNPYVLRKKGLYETLTGAEFARALFHINQRRGFLSNRKTDKKDAESGVLKKAIKDLRDKLQQENCQTLGEWLANRHGARLSVRARLRGRTQKDKAYDFYADRAMIEHEFDAIWAKQHAFNPTLFNEDAHKELKDILLHQRPLKPVKPGRCTLLPQEERAPLALPSTQRFRIYQELNNLRILAPDFREQTLTLDQRNVVAQVLERGDATFFKITKALKLPGTTKFNLQDIKREKLKGNHTTAVLSKDQLFGERWHAFSPALQDVIVEKLLNEISESAAVTWLQRNTGVDEAAAESIVNTRLPEGYGSLSKAALNRILPALVKDVVVYAEAVKRAGFDSHSALSHALQTGEILQALPYYAEPLQRHVGFGSGDPADIPEKRFGRIANPTVHIGLNELRKVVNALIKRYGHPSEIIVEVARDLKLGRERKQEIEKEQKDRQNLNDMHVAEACSVLGLTLTNLDKAKRRELSQRMQLWVELNKDITNRRCPYTGEQISVNRLLSDEVEIDHILPYSITLDDSLNNKTVALRRANRDKGNRTPHDAFGAHSMHGYDYANILERAALMPKEKAKRFASDGYQQWLKEDKDFLARALNDTSYLSRIAREYLTLICPPNKVRAIPGRMTALLRGKFGLNHLLSGSGLKNRDDHRHHALDAAVIGITDQGLLQRFAQASATARVRQLDRLVDDVPFPWPTYREHVERALRNIVVSHKPDHGYQGAMHEETAWGLRNNGVATRRVRPEEGGARQREFKNKNLVLISSTRDPARHGLDERNEPKAYKGYVGGSNYCIEIWRDEKGKWNSDVVSTFHAYQIIREFGEVEGLNRLRNTVQSQSGKPLVMRLMIDDTLAVTDERTTRLLRVVKLQGDGRTWLVATNEANVRQRVDAGEIRYLGAPASTLFKLGARRVTISAIGDLRDPGFRK